MKLNSANRLLSILIPVVAIAAAQPASAMSPGCETLAMSRVSVSPLAQAVISTAGGSAFLGIGLGVAELMARRNPNLVLGGARFGVTSVGLAAGALATSSVGSLSALVRATALSAEPVSAADQRDIMRQYRGTQDYRCVKAELGRARTEEFFANAFSGWSIEELAREYLSGAEYDRFLAISALANCSEETMTCGG